MKSERYTLIGKRIRGAREHLNISQTELAKAAGFESATAISLIEGGERRVGIEELEKIAEKLQVDPDYLLKKEGAYQEHVFPNIRTALRADKDLTKEDKDALLRFIQLAKGRKKWKESS